MHVTPLSAQIKCHNNQFCFLQQIGNVITPVVFIASFYNSSLLCFECHNVYVILPLNKWHRNCNLFCIHRWTVTSLINTPLGCQHLEHSCSIRLSLWGTTFLSLILPFTFCHSVHFPIFVCSYTDLCYIWSNLNIYIFYTIGILFCSLGFLLRYIKSCKYFISPQNDNRW